MAVVQTSNQQHAGNVALAATGVAILTLLPVAAHQLGFLHHLPDPPSQHFASDEITESKAAHPLGIPDSLLGLVSYSATFTLLLAARRFRIARPLLKVKLSADAAAATGNSIRQVVSFGKLCSWCTGTAIATAAVVHFGRKSLEES